MAIPISEYIDIKSKYINASGSTRDFSGLIFTDEAMTSGGASDPYASVRTSYASGNAVAVTRDTYAELFASTTLAYQFCAKYFGYDGGNKTVSLLYVAKLLDNDTGSTAYARVVKQDSNFGSFTFLTEVDDLDDVSQANASSEFVMMIALASSTSAITNPYDGNPMTHVVLSADTSSGNPTLSTWMPMAWYASVDYSARNASATIDYKQFAGENEAVSDAATKNTLDGIHVNYVGLVQTNGQNIKFYQRGVNCDGIDLGVVRDKVWIEGNITAGWFTLATNSQKIPANYVGAAMVRTMIIGVVNASITNGAILIDKPLSDVQVAQIRNITDDQDAPESVSTLGYYIATEIVSQGEKYTVRYVLIYAKGDHIEKVVGTHYLV